MILVVDANILFSALIRAGTVRRLLLLSSHDFYSPEFSIQEFRKHLPTLQKKTGLVSEELNRLLDQLLEASGLKLVPFEEFKGKRSLAERISPDINDVAYLALALQLGCAIWSNDKQLKKQSAAKVLTTEELLQLQ